METVELHTYQFPEGIKFKDFGDGQICLSDDTGSYLTELKCIITDGKFESELKISSLGKTLHPVKILKSEMDKALDFFLKGRAALETK